MTLVQSRIVTHDVARLARFYEKLTGVRPQGSEEYVEFRIGGGLAICSKRSADLFNGRAAIPSANKSVILDFQVEDVDHEYLRVQNFVQEFTLEPTDQPWGNRSMIFCDPDGNIINIFSVLPGAGQRHGCGRI